RRRQHLPPAVYGCRHHCLRPVSVSIQTGIQSRRIPLWCKDSFQTWLQDWPGHNLPALFHMPAYPSTYLSPSRQTASQILLPVPARSVYGLLYAAVPSDIYPDTIRGSRVPAIQSAPLERSTGCDPNSFPARPRLLPERRLTTPTPSRRPYVF